MKYPQLISCLFLVLFFSCNEVKPKGEGAVLQFIEQWNNDHTLVKSPYLQRDYMDVVNYYGEELTKNEVQQRKSILFKQFPDYTQKVFNDDLVISKEAGLYLVTFTKQVNYNGVETLYPSYLSVIIKNRAVKILREGVALDAKNLDAPIFPNTVDGRVNRSNKRQLFGDFDGDGLSDYASVISPQRLAISTTDIKNSDVIQCQGDCNSVIVFSNKNLQPITIEGAYQSQLENLKDLNNDGSDEIGFWNIKENTKTLSVFNAITGQLLTDPIVINTSVHRNLNLIDVFKKTGPKKITVTRSVQADGRWTLKSEVIILD